MPQEMEDFGESLATAAAFSSNFMFWSEAGYFDGPSEFKPLLHTWSLAIEEQYYLLFPLLLLACKRAGLYLPILLPVALASLILAEWFVNAAPSATFFLLPHRLWELMVGSLLAVAAIRNPHWFTNWQPALREALSLAGVLAIGITVLTYSNETTFPGVNAMLPTLGTACLIAAGIGGSTATSKVLSMRPLVAIGLISYSLYLWHWPVLVFVKLYLIRPPTPTEIVMSVAASFILGWASWRFVERPFRTQRKTQGLVADHNVLRASLASIAVLIAAGLTLDATEGAAGRLPDQVVKIAQVSNDKPPERKHCSNVAAADVSFDRLCRLGTGTEPPDFILWGDSHAMTLAPRFAEAANAAARTGLNATSNGCAALLNSYRPIADPEFECPQFNAAVLNLIATTPSITTIVLAGRWAIYAETTRYKYESGRTIRLVEVDPKTNSAQAHQESSAIVWERSLRRTLAALRTLDKKVVVIASIPEVGWDTPNIIARSVRLNRPVNIAPTLEEFLARQRQVLPVLASLEERVLHPQNQLCNATICRAASGTQPLYIDEDHLSTAGSRELTPLVQEALHP